MEIWPFSVRKFSKFYFKDLVMIHVLFHPICHLDIRHDSIPIIIIFIKSKVKEFFIIHASHHSSIMANRATKINNNMAKIIMAVSNRQIMLQVTDDDSLIMTRLNTVNFRSVMIRMDSMNFSFLPSIWLFIMKFLKIIIRLNSGDFCESETSQNSP